MLIETRRTRALWTHFLLGFVPDIAISAALAYYLNGGLLGFGAAFLGLQVLYLAIWAKNSIWEWAVYNASGRKTLAKAYVGFLKSNGFPEPEEYERSFHGYLDSVASNEKYATRVRLVAARELGTILTFDSMGFVQHSMRVTMACEDALLEYKQQFPPKPAEQGA
ncbi:MAG: hypothetical protein AB7R40_24190 [Nitrospiraceae bacterium]